MSVNKVNSDGSLTKIAGGASEASNIAYDNTDSGLIASNVQDAIDEIAEGGGGGGLLPHLIIISEDGESEVKAVKGSTEIIATRTSAGHYECDVTEFGTWTIHAVLNGDDATVNLVVDTVKVYTVDDSHWHADITVTYPSGGTCSCSKSGETTLYATGSPYTFTVHSAGAWTITAVAYGKTFTQTINVSESGQTVYANIPDGATITPTDDIQILLACAGIGDSQIAMLSELFADTTTLSAVINSNNAIDYLVRSKSFAKSEALVPTMTSSTTPSGVVSASSENSNNGWAYQAFDGNDSTIWGTSGNVATAWIQYEWDSPRTVTRYSVLFNNTVQQDSFKISRSSDGETFTDITETISTSTLLNEGIATKNIGRGTICRLTTNGNAGYGKYAKTIQFYSEDGFTENETAMTYIGLNNYAANILLAETTTWRTAICNSAYFEEVLNVKNPAMTSNTTPEGEASATGAPTTGAAWQAFDGNTRDGLCAVGGQGTYIAYRFTRNVPIYKIVASLNGHTSYQSKSETFKFQAVNSDTEVAVDITDAHTESYYFSDFKDQTFLPHTILTNADIYRYYFVSGDDNTSNYVYQIYFYGREDV